MHLPTLSTFNLDRFQKQVNNKSPLSQIGLTQVVSLTKPKKFLIPNVMHLDYNYYLLQLLKNNQVLKAKTYPYSQKSTWRKSIPPLSSSVQTEIVTLWI